jgi:pimeloyl-ACP methyl ester carboxylesterase
MVEKFRTHTDGKGTADRTGTQTGGATTTHAFGGTFAPAWILPRVYGRLAGRLANGGPVRDHATVPLGGIGRTDKTVESFALIFERARPCRLRVAGHSLGGVVGRALAHDYPNAVEVLEVWATPVRGTGVAWLFHHLGAEARFLTLGQPLVKALRRPAERTRGPSMYTACDLFVVAARQSSSVEGDQARNHLLSPFLLHRSNRRPGQRVHTGWADHLVLPRYPTLVAA